MNALLQTIIVGIAVGALYGLVALGFGLIMGVMKFVNIAHGSFIIIGGYIAYWLFTLWKVGPYLSIPVVMCCMFVMGLILFRLTLSPLLKFPRAEMRMDKSLLVTFGVTWVLDNVVTMIWTSDTRSVMTSYAGSTFSVLGGKIGLTGFAGLVVAVLMAILLHLLLSSNVFWKARQSGNGRLGRGCIKRRRRQPHLSDLLRHSSGPGGRFRSGHRFELLDCPERGTRLAAYRHGRRCPRGRREHRLHTSCGFDPRTSAVAQYAFCQPRVPAAYCTRCIHPGSYVQAERIVRKNWSVALKVGHMRINWKNALAVGVVLAVVGVVPLILNVGEQVMTLW